MGKSANHATKGSGGDYCRRCSSPVGIQARVQPTTCDGEVFCPRCFVWHRMREESAPLGVVTAERPRFQAHQAAVVKCQHPSCGWLSVCFGARPGGSYTCGHCGKRGAQLITPELDDVRAMQESLRDAVRAVEKAR